MSSNTVLEINLKFPEEIIVPRAIVTATFLSATNNFQELPVHNVSQVVATASASEKGPESRKSLIENNFQPQDQGCLVKNIIDVAFDENVGLKYLVRGLEGATAAWIPGKNLPAESKELINAANTKKLEMLLRDQKLKKRTRTTGSASRVRNATREVRECHDQRQVQKRKRDERAKRRALSKNLRI